MSGFEGMLILARTISIVMSLGLACISGLAVLLLVIGMMINHANQELLGRAEASFPIGLAMLGCCVAVGVYVYAAIVLGRLEIKMSRPKWASNIDRISIALIAVATFVVAGVPTIAAFRGTPSFPDDNLFWGIVLLFAAYGVISSFIVSVGAAQYLNPEGS